MNFSSFNATTFPALEQKELRVETLLTGKPFGLSWADLEENEQKGVSNSRLMSDEHENVVKSVRKALGGLIFRRVAAVILQNPEQLKMFKDDDKFDTFEGDRIFKRERTMSDAEYEKNAEYRYSKFNGFTTRTALRGTDRYNGAQLEFHSSRYSELNVLDGTFTFSKYRGTKVAPREGDLICGNVEQNGKRFEEWFICSEQFYRMWTLVMNSDHESFTNGKAKGGVKPDEGEEGIKRFYFSGNRLCTANYKKWRMVRTEEECSEKEKSSRYFRLRTEPISREWVHVYAAIVLICRYNEFPSSSNIPRNLEKDAKNLPEWHIPKNFVSTFLSVHNVVSF